MYRFNPGMIEHEGKVLLAYRECCDHSAWASTICLADLFGNVAVNSRPLKLAAPQHANDGVSDPRLFYFRDHLHVSYSYDKGTLRTSNVAIAKIDADGNAFNCRVFPRRNGGRQEKNWQFFEFDGELRIVYSLAPHHVILDAELNIVAKTPGIHWPGGTTWPAGKPRGGTPPMLCGEHYVSFFHATTDCSRKIRDRFYVAGAYEFEARPPFRIVRQSIKPLLMPNPAARPSGNNRPEVVFPCGAMLGSSGVWSMTYGYYDDHARILSFPDPFDRPNPQDQGEVIQWS